MLGLLTLVAGGAKLGVVKHVRERGFEAQLQTFVERRRLGQPGVDGYGSGDFQNAHTRVSDARRANRCRRKRVDVEIIVGGPIGRNGVANQIWANNRAVPHRVRIGPDWG